MAVIVLEAFSADLPSFITNNKAITNVMNKRGIDLANAKYIRDTPPSSGRDKKLSDPNRIPVYLLNDGNVYIPNMYSPRVSINNNGEYVSADRLSGKNLLGFTKQYGYIDVTDASNFNTAKRADRKAAKAGSIDRGKGQYKAGDAWYQMRGQDKSGYKLPSPYKYSQMLDDVDMDNYADKLEYFYNRINKVRQQLVTIMSDIDIKNPRGVKGTYYSRDPMDIVGAITRDLSRVSYNYRNLIKEINSYLNNEDYTGEEKERAIKSAFRYADISDMLRGISRDLKGLADAQ